MSTLPVNIIPDGRRPENYSSVDLDWACALIGKDRRKSIFSPRPVYEEHFTKIIS